MKPNRPSGLTAVGAAATGAGAALVATAASACCATPALAALSVTVLGASGAAWAAGLTPYAGWLLAASALLVGFGAWTVERTWRRCVRHACAIPSSLRLARRGLALAVLLWLLAAAVRLAPLVGGAT